ncbi:glycosyltransferase family 4 protein [Carboxylicivirga marina]|uniref:glycosyltransferase family 4 protein n=1 Tax=Carboxylicivirga marina TaxID=2800988 RepID=UPI002594316B|nr:glycosyltransferase family 1 protein [uncultured Carboxylicivirga sp.]
MPNKLHITYFFRKPQPQYFSIEKVFEQVINKLPDNIVPHIYKLKNGTNGWWGRLKALIEVWRNKRVINHITGDITFIALALPKKGLVVTYHDLESLTQYKSFKFKLLKYLWVTIPVNRAQIVTAISQHTKEQLIKWTGCDEHKIVVVANPLPEELTYTPKTFNKQCPTILVMGTKANKNVEGIFEAVYRLSNCKNKEERSERREESGNQKTEEKRDEREEESSERRAVSSEIVDRRPKSDGEEHCVPNTKYYKLIVVGKMTEKQTLLAEQYQLNIENLVQVPYEAILDTYKRCDLLCFPSFYEGFGLPIIEAQAIGRPVITSNFGAMKEVAGRAASLVNPNKIQDIQWAIGDILEVEKLRSFLVEEGLKNVERFKGEVIAEAYNKVYEKV